jgi:Tol biopolymer transport system component
MARAGGADDNGKVHARSLRRCLLVAVLPVLAGLAVVSTASSGRAAFPGANGRLLYITGPETRARLCVVDARGGVPTPVATGGRILFGARWSPSGTQIAYSTSSRYGDGRIIVASPSGAAARLALSGGNIYELAWSPDGRWVAFVEWWSARGPETAIAISRIAGRRRQERYLDGMIGSDDLGEYRSPAWSPDGRRIAFSFRVVGESEIDIYTIGVFSGVKRRLTTDPAADIDPSWSPGGRRIAFSSNRDGHRRIYVMDADGSNSRPLTRGVEDRDPAWSPDGRSVAFIRVGGARASLRTLEVATGRERLVTRVPKGAYSLDWQPLRRGASAGRPPARGCGQRPG